MTLTATLGDLAPITFSTSAGSNITLEASPVKIDGANYTAFATGDGYCTIRNVPCFGEVPQGVKDAPENIGATHHDSMIAKSIKRYREGKFASPVHLRHHKTLDISSPEFLGFFLPKSRGEMTLDGKRQSVVFCDLKLKRSAVDRAIKGELPYISPEVNWETMEFSSLAFLDSQPPHFKAPLFTISRIVEDSTAKFEAVLETATFQEGKPEKKEEKKPEGEKKPFAEDNGTLKPERIEEQANQGECCRHCSMYADALEKLMRMTGVPLGGAQYNDSPKKQDATPVDPRTIPGRDIRMASGLARMSEATEEKNMADSEKKPETKAPVSMEDDPKTAAKLAAFDAELQTVKAKLAERDREDAIKARVEKAKESLKGFALTPKHDEYIRKFAAMGDEQLNDFVESTKAVAPKEGAKSFAEFESNAVQMSDPVLAKFQQQGPEALAQAARLLSEYRQLKSTVKAYSLTPEQHIERGLKALSVKEG